MAQADDDLLAADQFLEQGRLHLVFFMCHEALEKALRSFLISKGKHYATHSVFWLSRTAAKLDARFEAVRDDAWTLDTLYGYSRYPFGAPPKPPKDFFTSEADAREAVQVAREVLSLVRETAT